VCALRLWGGEAEKWPKAGSVKLSEALMASQAHAFPLLSLI